MKRKNDCAHRYTGSYAHGPKSLCRKAVRNRIHKMKHYGTVHRWVFAKRRHFQRG